MAKITDLTTQSATAAAWVGDYTGREHNLPGGAKLVASAFTADSEGRRTVPSGTLVGRTYAERDAGTGFGPADVADNEVYLVLWDVTDAAMSNDVELYRHGSLVKENYLPGWNAMAAGLKALVRANYETTKGGN